jgi:hypothetical protein
MARSTITLPPQVNRLMSSFVVSSSWPGLFPVQLAWLALIAFNTAKATVNYLAKDTEAAVIAQLDNS